jgi:hypothetical protein
MKLKFMRVEKEKDTKYNYQKINRKKLIEIEY